MDMLPPPAIESILATPAAGENRFIVYFSGYASGDNTPKGSRQTTIGERWGFAGGSGTYDDPITLAVGHSITRGRDIPDYPRGTKFYVPYLRKYFSAQDSCGDGDTPQNGPCHTGYQGFVWLDVYIGDINGARAKSCETAITDLHVVIQNPARNYVVVPGSVVGSGCTVFADDVVTDEVAKNNSGGK